MLFLVTLACSASAQGWTVVNTGYATNINGVTYLTDQTLFAVCSDGKILTSSNGGNSWTVSYTASTGLNDVTTVNASTTIAVGWDGLILRYDGSSWNIVNSGTTKALFGVDFGDELVGYAVGQDGIILKSLDGGLTWNTIREQKDSWLSDVHALNPVVVSTVSEDGGLLHTTDGGTIWTTMVIPGNPWLGGVINTGPNAGWCCGTDGTLYYFDGTTLTPYDIGGSQGLMALALISLFNDFLTGIMVGDAGVIYQFMNGDWAQMASPTTNFLFCLALCFELFLDDNAPSADSAFVNYCAGGEDGIILLNTQTVVSIRDPLPGQNSSLIYPNPVTLGVCFIGGRIPAEGIYITIMDMHGKTLLEQQILNPMTPIDLRNLPGGIYIAHIRKENRNYTEKIILP